MAKNRTKNSPSATKGELLKHIFPHSCTAKFSILEIWFVVCIFQICSIRFFSILLFTALVRAYLFWCKCKSFDSRSLLMRKEYREHSFKNDEQKWEKKGKSAPHTNNWLDLLRFVYGHHCTIDVSNNAMPAKPAEIEELNRRLCTKWSVCHRVRQKYPSCPLMLRHAACNATEFKCDASNCAPSYHSVSQSVTHSIMMLFTIRTIKLTHRHTVCPFSLSLALCDAHYVSSIDGPEEKKRNRTVNFDVEKTER